MARGILHGAISGLGEGLLLAGGYLARSALQKQAEEAQRLRDERLEEFALAREQRGYAHAKDMVSHVEEARTRRAIEAGKAAEAAAGAMVDDLSGAVRQQSASEQVASRAKALRSRGYLNEAIALEREQREQEARTEDRLMRREELQARTSQDERQHAERMALLKQQINHQAAQIGLEKRKVDMLESVNVLDVAQKKAIEEAREAYKAETDPEKKHEKGATYLTLLGKVGERYKEIKESDPSDPSGLRQITVGFFDTLSGKEIARHKPAVTGNDPLNLRDKLPKPAERVQSPAPSTSVVPDARAVTDELPEGRALDEARALRAAAEREYQSYGVIKRKRDPTGFQRARADLEQARHAERLALEKWQQVVGNTGAARMTRKP